MKFLHASGHNSDGTYTCRPESKEIARNFFLAGEACESYRSYSTMGSL